MAGKPKEDRATSLRKKKAEIERKLAALAAKERDRKRADDTRRKILVGALELDKAAHDPARAEKLREELAAWLVRDDERALFDLAPLQKPLA